MFQWASFFLFISSSHIQSRQRCRSFEEGEERKKAAEKGNEIPFPSSALVNITLDLDSLVSSSDSHTIEKEKEKSSFFKGLSGNREKRRN